MCVGERKLLQPSHFHARTSYNHDTSAAYRAATDLVFKGLAQPSGYTEPLLHAWRLKVKAGVA